MEPAILVTGATGNVGRETVRSLVSLGARVKAAVRAGEQDVPQGAEPVLFEFGNEQSYPEAMKGVDRLFLMRPPAIADVKRYLYPVIDIAERTGVRQIAFLSLMGVQFNPLAPHFWVEWRLKRSGVPYTLLRPTFYMQNLSTTYREEIRDRSRIFIPAGRGVTSFIDVRDIGAVAARVLTEPGHENKAYDLTGSEAFDYYRIADMLSSVLGRKIAYANPTPEEFEAEMLRRGEKPEYLQVMRMLYFVVRHSLSKKVTGDVRRLLDRDPITMRRFMEDYRDCWL